jgi:orotate phosphoribosyltransferase
MAESYTVKYVPPEPAITGWPKKQPPLSAALDAMLADLQPRMTTFDAILTAGDHHGIALAAALAAALWKPLVIVCVSEHTDDVVSHITCIGDFHPGMRTLYVDDFTAYGASLAHTFAYMCQSGTPNIVAVYQATPRTYTPVTASDVQAIAARSLVPVQAGA